jgi:hypothetical protein
VGVVVVVVVGVVVVVAVVVVEDVTVTVCITVEITVEMLVTVEVTVRVTDEQTLLIDVGEPPAPVEMPPTKSTARAAANMSLRVMFSLLSGEADVSRTACFANYCRHWKRSKVRFESRRTGRIRGARRDRFAERTCRRSGERVGVAPGRSGSAARAGELATRGADPLAC